MTRIKKYTETNATELMNLIESEGEEWAPYYQEPTKQIYLDSLKKAITYLIYEDEGEQLVGYAKTLDDGLLVWIVDLLVHREYRGKAYGKVLMDYVCEVSPNQEVYVLGGDDVLPYYDKLEYGREGVVYKVSK